MNNSEHTGELPGFRSVAIATGTPDRYFAPDIRKTADLIQQDALSDLVEVDIRITQLS